MSIHGDGSLWLQLHCKDPFDIEKQPQGTPVGYTPDVRWGLFCLLVVVAAACGKSSTSDGGSGAFRDPTTLIVGRPADSISLDPARITDNESVEICEQVYEGLLRYRSGTSEVEAALATTWEVSEDGREWTFQLRRDVDFHDGTPFNADAVVFSFQRQLDPEHPYHLPDASGVDFAWQATYKNIESIEAIGEHRLRIVIDRKYAPFVANLAMFPASIVSPTAVKKWGREYFRHPVGTGAFRFASWADERVVLERNDRYWGKVPKLRRLVFKSIADGRQRLVALESRAIDIAYSILPDEQQFVTLHPQLQLRRAALNNVTYLAMNTQRPPFQDLRVRRAFNHAINKELIVKLAYQGMAIAADGPLPPGHAYRSPGSFEYEFDLDKARSLLAEAAAEGAFDPEQKIRLYVPRPPRPYLPNPKMVTKIVIANLDAVGVKVEVVEQGFRDHLASVRNGEHDVCLLGWVGDNADPDNYLYVLFDEDNGKKGTARNLAFLQDATLHKLLVSGQKVARKSSRAAIYNRAQSRIGKLAPWVPLAHSQVAIAARNDVKGIVLTPSALVMLQEVSRK